MEKVFDGEPTFQDSNNVIVPSAGAPDTAGFVQVMEGQSSDPDRSVQLMYSSRDARVAHRPDQAQMQEMQSLSVGQPNFLDLKTPWLDSPGNPRSPATVLE